MADSKKKALIQAAAEMIRKAGKQTAGADTVLAHITPEEAAKLKAEGGSGRTDPVTGLPHFKQDKDSENSGRRDADNEGNDSKSDSRSSGHDKSDEDKYEKELKDLKEHFGPETEADREAAKELARDMDAYRSGSGGKEQLPSLPSIPNVAPETLTLENLNPAAPVTTKPLNTKNAMKGASVGFKIGGPPGALVGLGAGLFGREEETHLVSPPNSLTPEKQATKSARESNGGDYAAVKAPVADETTDTKKLTETVAAPTFDDFTAKARKKKGYLSTILGGGVPAGTPQGKRLLGS